MALDLSTTRKILAALGGAKAIAARRACGASTISNWHRVGFPRALEGDLLTLGTERGLGAVLTLDVLRAASARAVADAAAAGGSRGRRLLPVAANPPHQGLASAQAGFDDMTIAREALQQRAPRTAAFGSLREIEAAAAETADENGEAEVLLQRIHARLNEAHARADRLLSRMN